MVSNNNKPHQEEELNKDAPGRVELCSDTDTNLSKHKLVNLICYELANATEEYVLVFQPVDSDIAHSTAEELDRLREGERYRLSYDSLLETLKIVIVPNRIHDCHQPWLTSSMGMMMATGFLTAQEYLSLRISAGTTFKSFGAGYALSRKEPNQCVTPQGMILPTLVVESGWSESRAQLHRDRDLWLTGGQGSVQVVIILKWSKTQAKKVTGDIEVFELDALGNVQSIQKEIIFPVPPTNIANMQKITLSKHQLFSPNLSISQIRSQVTHLNINDLRIIADEYLRIQGYTPAR